MLKIETGLLALLVVLTGCQGHNNSNLDDLLVLAADDADGETRLLIERVRTQSDDYQSLEALGDRLLDRGLVTGDASRYETALLVAKAISGSSSISAETLRVRALLNLHRFEEAGNVLRLLHRRTGGRPIDDLLYGDVLLEQGQIDEAARAYQRRMDHKPDALAYGRAARLRFLKGDIAEAVRLNQSAARAAHPHDRLLMSWLLSEGSQYAMALGDVGGALVLAQEAVARSPSVGARFRLAQATLGSRQREQALAQLLALADDYPSPRVLWWLEGLYREMGQDRQADKVAAHIEQLGERIDPRGFAHWLVTRGRELSRARQIILAELKQRQDAQTLGILAALDLAEGYADQACIDLDAALSTGFPSPELHLLAGRFCGTNHSESRVQHLELAKQLRYLLPPGGQFRVGHSGKRDHPFQQPANRVGANRVITAHFH